MRPVLLIIAVFALLLLPMALPEIQAQDSEAPVAPRPSFPEGLEPLMLEQLLTAIEFSVPGEYAGDIWLHCPDCGAVDPGVQMDPSPLYRPPNGGHFRHCRLYPALRSLRGWG